MVVQISNKWVVRSLAILMLAFSGCGRHFERPFGVIRVGGLKGIPAGKTVYFEEYGLLVQRDSEGIRAMSTLHPVTFSPLDRTTLDDHVLFRDPASGTLFDEAGRVQNVQSETRNKGGALSPVLNNATLTHYRVLFDRVAGDLEVLVVVGDVRPSTWRLRIPG